MSLAVVSDGFLAAAAARGDGVAFAELACRYRPLIVQVTRGWTVGLEREDARQLALIGLFQACREHDPARGYFAGLASLRVRSMVHNARIQARRHKHAILTEAYRNGDDPVRQLEQRAAAPEGSDPARVVELREELRRRAERAQRRVAAPRGDLRRRYSDEQITRALALLAAGQTPKQAAFAVGASRDQVRSWAQRAGQPHGGRRCFTAEEIRTAVELVRGGATMRQAAAAVGASNVSVLKWVRKAA